MVASVTYVFSPGNLIESAEVNQNFDDLVDYFNDVVDPKIDSGFLFYGDGTDGDLNVTSGTTSLTPGKMYQYESMNVSGGATLNLSGNSKLPLVILVRGNVTIAGTIDLSGLGLTGGASVTGTTQNGNKGQDWITNPAVNISAQASAYVGGADGPAGSGGGSLINPGIVGQGSGGVPGIDFISSNDRTVIPLTPLGMQICNGGGGGSGANGSVSSTSGVGGDGGCSIIIVCKGNLTVTGGTIDCSGNDGGDDSDATATHGGGGGAGAGGSILIAYAGTKTGTETTDVTGGTGGLGGDFNGGDGGDGTAYTVQLNDVN